MHFANAASVFAVGLGAFALVANAANGLSEKTQFTHQLRAPASPKHSHGDGRGSPDMNKPPLLQMPPVNHEPALPWVQPWYKEESEAANRPVVSGDRPDEPIARGTARTDWGSLHLDGDERATARYAQEDHAALHYLADHHGSEYAPDHYAANHPAETHAADPEPDHPHDYSGHEFLHHHLEPEHSHDYAGPYDHHAPHEPPDYSGHEFMFHHHRAAPDHYAAALPADAKDGTERLAPGRYSADHYHSSADGHSWANSHSSADHHASAHVNYLLGHHTAGYAEKHYEAKHPAESEAAQTEPAETESAQTEPASVHVPVAGQTTYEYLLDHHLDADTKALDDHSRKKYLHDEPKKKGNVLHPPHHWAYHPEVSHHVDFFPAMGIYHPPNHYSVNHRHSAADHSPLDHHDHAADDDHSAWTAAYHGGDYWTDPAAAHADSVAWHGENLQEDPSAKADAAHHREVNQAAEIAGKHFKAYHAWDPWAYHAADHPETDHLLLNYGWQRKADQPFQHKPWSQEHLRNYMSPYYQGPVHEGHEPEPEADVASGPPEAWRHLRCQRHYERGGGC